MDTLTTITENKSEKILTRTIWFFHNENWTMLDLMEVQRNSKFVFF